MIITIEAATMLMRAWTLKELCHVPSYFCNRIAVKRYPNTTPSGGDTNIIAIKIGFWARLAKVSMKTGL